MKKRLIAAMTPSEAWKGAARTLLDAPAHRLAGLTVRIADPVAEDTALVRELDSRMNGATVRSVARTIMPRTILIGGDWQKSTRRLSPKLGSRSYFRRMTDYHSDGGTVNQIANVIESMRRRNTRGQRLVDPGPIILERPGASAIAHRSFPCLSLIQFHRFGDDLKATAIYRSHYYDEKAYGNFIGLGRLQSLVARECGLRVGELTVVSTDARIVQLATVAAILQATAACTN
jgi:thymidylate synthase